MKKYNIIILLAVFLFGFYAFNNKSKNDMHKEALTTLLFISLNGDLNEMSNARDSIGLDNVITIKYIDENNDEVTSEGYVNYKGECRHIIASWKKGKLLTPENLIVSKNKPCPDRG